MIVCVKTGSTFTFVAGDGSSEAALSVFWGASFVGGGDGRFGGIVDGSISGGLEVFSSFTAGAGAGFVRLPPKDILILVKLACFFGFLECFKRLNVNNLEVFFVFAELIDFALESFFLWTSVVTPNFGLFGLLALFFSSSPTSTSFI